MDREQLAGVLRRTAARGAAKTRAAHNHGGIVRPVLDYREHNDHVIAFTVPTATCVPIRCVTGVVNVSVLDLRKIYLQLRVDQQLWPFQTVMVRGQWYCLTRLGFGLNVAPLGVMAVIKTILTQDSKIECAVQP